MVCACNVGDLEIFVMYHNDDLVKIENINIGDWTDLRSSEYLELKAMDFVFINLGISVQIPEGYEMHIAPRGSTYKNFGIIQVNSVGVLDESFCSPQDVVKMPALALRDTVIRVNDRICQCRLMPKQPKTKWVTVDYLNNETRGGFGSSGINDFIGNAKIV
jgi:dUTP pyrophosphatase